MNQADQINDAADVVLNGTFNMGGNEQIRTLSGTDAAAAINLGTNTQTTIKNNEVGISILYTNVKVNCRCGDGTANSC